MLWGNTVIPMSEPTEINQRIQHLRQVIKTLSEQLDAVESVCTTGGEVDIETFQSYASSVPRVVESLRGDLISEGVRLRVQCGGCGTWGQTVHGELPELWTLLSVHTDNRVQNIPCCPECRQILRSRAEVRNHIHLVASMS